MDLPLLDCPTYANVALAEAACQGGVFLMWGESFNFTTGTITSSFLEEERAQYGPYYCETCFNGGEGYGYVGNDEVLPDLVDDTCHEGDSCLTQCPLVYFDTAEDTSCGGLQRYCEESGSGWLLYAKSFENFNGEIVCSGGCFSELFGVTDLEYGEFPIGLQSHAADLRSWPMFFMWAMIGVMFGAATLIDFKLYKGETKDWFARFFFCLLGYLDLDGTRRPFLTQIMVNPCACLCDCSCCTKNEPETLQEAEDRANEMGPARIGFLSLLILSLGVAILFGDGESYDQVCFFDAVPASEDEISYNVSLPHVFHGLSFGQDGPQDVLDEDPTVKIFDKEWWVSEMAIIMYEMAQELLAYNLVAAGYLGLKTTLSLMVINSCIFLLCCWSLYWGGLVWANLWESWFIGFIIAIMFTPIFNAMSYGLAKCIVKCGCLSEPECEDQAGSQTKSSQQKQDPSATSVLQKNDDQDDSAEEKEFFKVVVPEGMQPGQQLKVHMGSTSVASPLVVIPNREFWMSETIANANEESALQNFFYVETPKTADSKKEVSL